MLQPNTLIEKLERGEPTIGTHFLIPDPDLAEMIGDLGVFDYAEFSAEYSTFDMQRLNQLARAAQCGNLPLIIKLDQETQGFWAQAAIGAGFHGILFTDIRSPQEVEACVRVVRPETPEDAGRMGVKLRRNALSGYEVDNYVAHLRSLMLALMIEKHVAVENLHTILRRAQQLGVRFTQWGPADYAFSRGSSTDPDQLKTIEEEVIRASFEYGLQPRIEISQAEQAERYLPMGVKHFCIGWDRFILRDSLRSLGTELRTMLSAG